MSIQKLCCSAVLLSGSALGQASQDLTTLSLNDAARAIRTRQITSVQLTTALLARIEAHQVVNAMIFLDASAALKAAQAADQAVAEGKPLGPLHGVPLVIKDNIHVAGMPNTAGTPALRPFIPADDATVVRALRNAGAIILGKTNMHELAFGITSNNAAFGAVRNAYDTTRFAGGSSGGSAVAVALGLAPAALGTDTGGSVRVPSALNGVVGFRPSVKRYSQEGVTPLSSTRDTPGVIARSVADVLLLDQVITGDSSAPPAPSLKGLRLGVDRGYFFQHLDQDTAERTEAALEVLRQAGVEIVEVDIPKLAELNQKVSFPVVLFECKRDLSAYLSQYRVGLSIEQVAAQISSPDVKGVFGSAVLGDQAVPEQVYREAMEVYRPQLQAAYREAFRNYRIDALIFPTTPLPAQPVAGSDENVMLNGKPAPTFATFIQNTDPGSNAGIPGLTLPFALSADGLPLGLELDGPAGSDAKVLAVGLALEKVLDFRSAPAP